MGRAGPRPTPEAGTRRPASPPSRGERNAAPALHLVFQGASGDASYTGRRDQTPSLPVVQEVEQLGDFEAVLSWGAGLSRASCLRTLELATPTRLVIDVPTP